MTEDGSNSEQIEEHPQGPGDRLRQVRESRRLSIHDVSMEMRIDKHVINDIEHDRYDEYEPIFISGYLRKYARLLDLPGDDVVADYKRISNRQPPELSATVGHRQVRSDNRLFLYISYLIAAVFIGMLVAWWLGNIDTGPQPPVAELAAEAYPEILDRAPAVPGMPDAAETTDQETTASVTPMPEVQQPAVNAAEDATPQQAADTAAGTMVDAAPLATDAPLPAPPAGDAGLPDRVLLDFREDSWAEVTDAKGQRRLFGLYRRGQVIEIEGSMPMEISLGNAAGVEIKYNGKPYDFSADIRPTGTARFVVK
jgi:cytoskeleton protein RodZ